MTEFKSALYIEDKFVGGKKYKVKKWLDMKRIKICTGFTEVDKCKERKKNVFHDRDWEKALGEGNQAQSSNSQHEEWELFNQLLCYFKCWSRYKSSSCSDEQYK